MIRVSHLAIEIGNFSIRDVSFEVPSHGYGVLMGKTGYGKTTILEAICGLRHIQAGRIELAGRDVTVRKPAERGVGFVPQDGALFSTMTVWEHLAFSLRVRRLPHAVVKERVEELAALLGIESLLKRYPQGLSGGESQRVALGRALSSKPTVLCMDEPLGALDDETRDSLCDLLRSVRRQTGVTALHVTHSRREAKALATRVYIIEGGKVRDLPPEELEPVEEEPSRKRRASPAPGDYLEGTRRGKAEGRSI